MKQTGIEAAFIGRIGQPATVRESKSGKPWAALTVAVAGSTEAEPVQWVQVSMFGDDVTEHAAKMLKGATVYVEGRLRLNTWKDRAGGERSGLTVAASKVRPLFQIGDKRPPRTRAKRGIPTDARSTPGHEFDDPLPPSLAG